MQPANNEINPAPKSEKTIFGIQQQNTYIQLLHLWSKSYSKQLRLTIFSNVRTIILIIVTKGTPTAKTIIIRAILKTMFTGKIILTS